MPYSSGESVEQETGHPNMMARVKAFKKMLDDTSKWKNSVGGKKAVRVLGNRGVEFMEDNNEYFMETEINSISVSRAQYNWMLDLYNKTLEN